MLVFRVSHSSLVWGFHLCQRLSLLLATTENRMRAAGKPLVLPAWDAPRGMDTRGAGLLCQTLPCLLGVLNHSPLPAPEVVGGQFSLWGKENSSFGGNHLSDMISILLIPRTCFSRQKTMAVGKCSLLTKPSHLGTGQGRYPVCGGESVTPECVGKSPTPREAVCPPRGLPIPEFLLVNAYISKSIKTHQAYFK